MSYTNGRGRLGARPTPAETARRALCELEDELQRLLGKEWSGNEALSALKAARDSLVEALEPARWRREQPREGTQPGNGATNGNGVGS